MSEKLDYESFVEPDHSKWNNLISDFYSAPPDEQKSRRTKLGKGAARVASSAHSSLSNPELDLIRAAERHVFAMIDKSDRSFNLFAADDDFIDPATFSPDTPGFKQIVDEPGFWMPDRTKIQDEGISRQMSEAEALSDSIRAAERELGISPTIYVLRGVAGSGKTYACANAGFPGMLTNEKHEPIGTLATDNSKTDLYGAGGLSDQIHAESASMYRKLKRRWRRHVREKGDDCSEIHDRVFDEPADVEEIVKDAKETGRSINALDIDVPYVVSAVRVLQRPKNSPEPHPNYEYLERAFTNTRRNRFCTGKDSIINQLIEAGEDGIDVDYKLYCYDYEDDPKVIQKEAARIEKNPDTGVPEIKILDEKLFEQATDPARIDQEISEVEQIVIDQKFVDWYCDTFFNKDPESQRLADKVRASLAEYVAREPKLTIYEALDDKNK
ncbi:zeta toxin family protein [Candidatus Saccharibacteria bacterium]|nr:zeta toxin family protein [Candidatus Saccharibacteria bacterium]